jgi:DNA-binding NarL/FixJ family response regulator
MPDAGRHIFWYTGYIEGTPLGPGGRPWALGWNEILERWLSVGGKTATRILLADNDARVRSALQHLLYLEPGQIVIHESADLESLASQIREFQPHLVLLDWELPGRPAAALLLAIHNLSYHPQVIVLSKRPESEKEALAAGADAFVSKSDPPERLLRSFRMLLHRSEELEQRR